MGQTRIFRDRVVSMEQTFEGGEKHLALLQDMCREALPDFELREHLFDHERDLFVMELEGPAGQRKRVGWTRMVLFDSERIPTLSSDPAAKLRGRIVEYLRGRADRPEIVVTFRHLEDGWVDTPEPRREGRRRRRGGRGRGGPERRPSPAPSEVRPPERRTGRSAPPVGGGAASARPAGGSAPGQAPATAAPAAGGRRRRRFRRRRRGRGGGGTAGPAPAASS